MDHRFEACIGFTCTHGYAFEFFQFLEEILDKVTLHDTGLAEGGLMDSTGRI